MCDGVYNVLRQATILLNEELTTSNCPCKFDVRWTWDQNAASGGRGKKRRRRRAERNQKNIDTMVFSEAQNEGCESGLWLWLWLIIIRVCQIVLAGGSRTYILSGEVSVCASAERQHEEAVRKAI